MKAELEFAPCRTMDAATEREVNAFLGAAETAHPLQYPSWGVSDLRDAGAGDVYMLGHEAGQIAFFGRGTLAPMFTRAVPWLRGLVVFRGPVVRNGSDMRPWMQRLVELANARGLAFIEICPDWAGQSNAGHVRDMLHDGWSIVPALRPRLTLRLELAAPEEQLFASFDPTARNLIRRAAREGVEVKPAATAQDLEDFFGVYVATARHKGFHAAPRGFFEALLEDFRSGKKRGAILLARHGADVLGGVVVVCAGGRAEYMYGGNLRRALSGTGFRSYGYVLQWEAIRWARSIGCREYDLGGYSEHGEFANAGFKKRFCANVVVFEPALRYVLRPKLHQLYLWRQNLRRRATALPSEIA